VGFVSLNSAVALAHAKKPGEETPRGVTWGDIVWWKFVHEFHPVPHSYKETRGGDHGDK